MRAKRWLRRQPIAPSVGGFDRRDVVLDHDVNIVRPFGLSLPAEG